MKRFLPISLCLLLVLIMLTGCTMTKTPLSNSAFSEIMEADGYQILDVTEEVDGGDVVLTATFAVKDDLKFEYYVLCDAETAANVFDSNKSDIESIGNGSYVSNSGENYSTFSGEYDGTYYHIACVEDTLLYVASDSAQKDTVKDILKELGY